MLKIQPAAAESKEEIQNHAEKLLNYNDSRSNHVQFTNPFIVSIQINLSMCLESDRFIKLESQRR